VELAQVAADERPANAALQALRTAAQTWDPAPAPAGSPVAQPGNTVIDAQVEGSQNVAIGTNIRQEVHYHTAPAPTRLWVNVPPAPTDPLLGRDDLLTDLVARVTAGHSPALSTDGLPGVGKTALAVALAHDPRVRAHFTDGVLWAGLGTQPDVITAQNQWATALGIDLSDEPDVHRRLQRLSGAVGERRVLVVIDDAWDVETPKSLRLSSPHAVHLVTSRDRTIARAFAGAAQQVHVPELAPDPALALLQRLAPEACAADPVAARALVATVGELPLAIEVLGGYLAGHELTVFPELTPGAFGKLGDARQRLALAAERLGGMPGKRETLEAVIRLSVEALEKMSPAAVAAFWALGAFAPNPATFERQAAEAVTGADSGVLALLVGRNLVEAADGGLVVHQVVHDVMGVGVAGEVRERHAQFYLDVVKEDREDWQRIEGVYPQVRYAWQGLADDDARLLAFMWALRIHFNRRGMGPEQIAWAERALGCARAQHDEKTVATLLNNIGSVYSALGDKRQALDYFEQSLPLFRQVGNKAGEANTLSNIGAVYSALGDQRLALDYFEQSLPLRRQVGDKAGEANTLNNIGLVYSDLGDKRHALDYFEQSLPLIRQVGDKDGEAITLNNIGLVYSDLGDKCHALDYFEQSLPLRRQVGYKGGEATTLNNIGLVYAALGDKRQALDYFEQSLPLRRQVGDKGGEATTLSNIGAVYSALGDKRQALDYYEQSLPLRRQAGDKAGEANTLNNIGGVYSDLGDKRRALDYFEQAMPLFRQVGNKGGEATTLTNIGAVYSALGDKRQALDYFEQAMPLFRQVGDRWGESVTRYQIAMAARSLGDLERAETELLQVVAIDEAVGHPNLASDRAMLEQVQRERRGG
jgi:tetratricopeptide (TPR) repeat protein